MQDVPLYHHTNSVSSLDATPTPRDVSARSAHVLKSVMTVLRFAIVVLSVLCTTIPRLNAAGAPTVFLIGEPIVEADTVASAAHFQRTIERLQRVQVVNLGPLINGPGVDYAPRVSADGRSFVFLSDRPGGCHDNHSSTSIDLWMCALRCSADEYAPASRLPDSVWNVNALRSQHDINTPANEGSATLNADGSSLVFSACDRSAHTSGCELFECTRNERGAWSAPEALPPAINSSSWEADPSYSADGKSLFFVRHATAADTESSRPASELLCARLAPQQSERRATIVALDTLHQISRFKDLAAPFLCADARTLFLSMSDAPDAKGRKDVVLFYRDSAHTWQGPVDAGPIVNSNEDDSYPSMAADGRVLFFSSRREDLTHYGDADIYAAFVPQRGAVNAASDGSDLQILSVSSMDSKAHFSILSHTSDSVHCWVSTLSGARSSAPTTFVRYSPRLSGVELDLRSLSEGLYTLHLEHGSTEQVQLFALKR